MRRPRIFRNADLKRKVRRPRVRRVRIEPPRLSERLILKWADAHRSRTGDWPVVKSGRLHDAPDESWEALNMSLTVGQRGLPGGTSLAKLLLRERGARRRQHPPRLTIPQILGWVDEHRARTGSWPTHRSGEIPGSWGEDWRRIDVALQTGLRGLPKSTLRKVLYKYRKVPPFHSPRRLSERLILKWVDSHRRRTGEWPRAKSGPVIGVPGETWAAIAAALNRGGRGLPGGTTLPQLLTRARGVRHRNHPAR